MDGEAQGPEFHRRPWYVARAKRATRVLPCYFGSGWVTESRTLSDAFLETATLILRCPHLVAT